MVIDMKKLILMTMVMFSLSSVYAQQDDGVVASSGHGQANTDCPAGDDSARSTVVDGPADTTVPDDGGSTVIDQ